MTDCREQLTFSFCPSKQVVADFQGGLISSDAGLLPIRELDQRLGWTARVAEQIVDSRQPGKVDHSMVALVRQRLFALIAGYEDGNDHTRLRHDPILKTVVGRDLDRPLGSQPVISRSAGRPTESPAGRGVYPTAATPPQAARAGHRPDRRSLPRPTAGGTV